MAVEGAERLTIALLILGKRKQMGKEAFND